MKLKEKLEEMFDEVDETVLDEYMRLTQLGSFLNLLGSSIDEFEDEKVINKFYEFRDYVRTRREEVYEMEIA